MRFGPERGKDRGGPWSTVQGPGFGAVEGRRSSGAHDPEAPPTPTSGHFPLSLGLYPFVGGLGAPRNEVPAIDDRLGSGNPRILFLGALTFSCLKGT